MPLDIHYARSGDVSIAYAVHADGPVDLAFVHGAISHIEVEHERPEFRAMLERLGRFARVIVFDRRGTGLSDRVRELPTLETRMDVDIRDGLPAVRVPTLVLASPRFVEPSRHVAQRIPGSRFVEVPGQVMVYLHGEELYGPIEEFARAAAGEPEPDTVLATTLFTDIVGSTAKASELGDTRWAELVERHHALVRRHLDRYRGTEMDTAGDGFFATFDGPIRA